MGFGKRFSKAVSRPFKAVGRVAKAVGRVFNPKMPSFDAEDGSGSTKYSEARSRAAGAGTVNYTEEGTR